MTIHPLISVYQTTEISCTTPNDILQQSSTLDHLCTRLCVPNHRDILHQHTEKRCSSPALLITYALASVYQTTETSCTNTLRNAAAVQHS